MKVCKLNSEKKIPYLIQIENHNSKNGSVNVVSFEQIIPFNVKRIFYVSNFKTGETRGKHSHKECWQFLIPLHGSIKIYCHDGRKEFNFVLKNKNEGLLVPPGVWCEQTYEGDEDILLVLTSEDYDPEDYIHDFDIFLKSL